MRSRLEGRHMKKIWLLAPLVALAVLAIVARAGSPAGEAALGTRSYDDFEPDTVCASCHLDIARQHQQAMMSQSYTHEWDEIEYFELALPHSEKVEKVAGVKAGCNGCHAPLAFLAGDIPPKPPAEGTRANEGVSCDLCHSIVGFEGEVPFNFNFTVEPGDVTQGTRPDVESPGHEIAVNEFLGTAEFCGTCHNEKDPWGLWVKATHLEWKESPQAAAGIVCQDCHMPPAAGNSAPETGGLDHPDVRQHLFHGAHDSGKLAGAVEVRIHPADVEAEPGDTIVFTATVVNAKAGHSVPSGSAEERVVWLHVEAVDASGTVHHLEVDAKGFEGEEFTIASDDALAYQDIGDIKGLENFTGLKRDGDVPSGDRIFRLPYLDEQGRMTVAQWNTAAFGTDYRLEPLKARNETFTWVLPDGLPPGTVTVNASVWYSKLVSSVAEYLNVPEEESVPLKMSEHSTTIEVKARG
jgi:nitrate/TMAO reductase-like tetraheme cytochrome c subunit